MPDKPLPDLPFFFGEIDDSKAMLNQEESHHLTKVLRKSIGDRVLLSDGTGKIVLAEILSLNKKESLLEVLECYEDESGDNKPKLTLALSLLKSNDRFELFLEKATELGVFSIQPFVSNRSERTNFNPDRYKKIISTACKQSRNSKIPLLQECLPLEKLILKTKDESKEKWIAHCHWQKQTLYIGDLPKPKLDSFLLIGPEGDFDESELDFALENGFASFGLGNRRLRSETAAILACAFWQEKSGNLQ